MEQQEWKVVSGKKARKIKFQPQEKVIQQVKERVSEFDGLNQSEIQRITDQLVEKIERKM
jgi:hypothetical protein